MECNTNLQKGNFGMYDRQLRAEGLRAKLRIARNTRGLAVSAACIESTDYFKSAKFDADDKLCRCYMLMRGRPEDRRSANTKRREIEALYCLPDGFLGRESHYGLCSDHFLRAQRCYELLKNEARLKQ